MILKYLRGSFLYQLFINLVINLNPKSWKICSEEADRCLNKVNQLVASLSKVAIIKATTKTIKTSLQWFDTALVEFVLIKNIDFDTKIITISWVGSPWAYTFLGGY